MVDHASDAAADDGDDDDDADDDDDDDDDEDDEDDDDDDDGDGDDGDDDDGDDDDDDDDDDDVGDDVGDGVWKWFGRMPWYVGPLKCAVYFLQGSRNLRWAEHWIHAGPFLLFLGIFQLKWSKINIKPYYYAIFYPNSTASSLLSWIRWRQNSICCHLQEGPIHWGDVQQGTCILS